MKTYAVTLDKNNQIKSVVRSDGKKITVGKKIQKRPVIAITHNPEFSSGFSVEWWEKGSLTDIEAIHIP